MNCNNDIHIQQEGLGIVGQCECKTNVQTRTCDECKVGFFNLSSSNMEGCQPCDCYTDGEKIKKLPQKQSVISLVFTLLISLFMYI